MNVTDKEIKQFGLSIEKSLKDLAKKLKDKRVINKTKEDRNKVT
tara:strand:+ start:811 stop:942 length:132 start_codon:yes stop_codon:yes gene_type:complete